MKLDKFLKNDKSSTIEEPKKTEIYTLKAI